MYLSVCIKVYHNSGSFFFFFFKHYVQVKYISPTAPVASQQYITGQKLMKIEITSADRCCGQVDMSEKKIHFLKKLSLNSPYDDK